jgi:hypothetical protein
VWFSGFFVGFGYGFSFHKTTKNNLGLDRRGGVGTKFLRERVQVPFFQILLSSSGLGYPHFGGYY